MPQKPNRFDYVKYDRNNVDNQQFFKEGFSKVAEDIETCLDAGPAKDKALQHLEEAYMWVGKALRDEQIKRNNGAFELQEERTDL